MEILLFYFCGFYVDGCTQLQCEQIVECMYLHESVIVVCLACQILSSALREGSGEMWFLHVHLQKCLWSQMSTRVILYRVSLLDCSLLFCRDYYEIFYLLTRFTVFCMGDVSAFYLQALSPKESLYRRLLICDSFKFIFLFPLFSPPFFQFL